MDALDRSTQSRMMFVLGLLVAFGILVGIAATRAPADRPCDLDARWALACYRWEAAGWPPCAESLPTVQVVHLTAAMVGGDDDVRGAWDEQLRIVAIRADSCGAMDPTTEHEQGHARGLEHGGPAGSVMASPWGRAGLHISPPGAP